MTAMTPAAARVRRPAQGASGRVVGASLVAALVLCVVVVADVSRAAPGVVHVALGALSMLYGLWAYVRHGEGRITVLGLLNLALAMFVGFAAVAEGVQPQFAGPSIFVTFAVATACIGQVAVTVLAWNRGMLAPAGEIVAAPPRDARVLVVGSVVLLLGLWIAQRAGVPMATSGYADGIAFTAVTLLAVGVLFRDLGASAPPRLLVIGAALSAYAVFFHQGTGRLRLVALACALGLLATARFPSRRIKGASILAMPLALIWLARERLSLQESLAAGSSVGRTGLESMLSPIRVFARVIEATSTGEHSSAMGLPFLSVPFSVIPEEWSPPWVPPAIGYELVRLTAPERYGSGYSVASTLFGEWFYNFAWLGVLTLIPVLAWLVTVLDRAVRRSLDQLGGSRFGVIRLAFWAMLAGGVGDLVWSGVHTWVARMFFRIPVLLVFMVAVRGPRPESAVGRSFSSPGRRMPVPRR